MGGEIQRPVEREVLKNLSLSKRFGEAYRTARAEFNAAFEAFAALPYHAYDRASDPLSEVYTHLENSLMILRELSARGLVGLLEDIPAQVRGLNPKSLEEIFEKMEDVDFSPKKAAKLPPEKQFPLFAPLLDEAA